MKTFNYSYPVNVYFGEGSAKTAFSNELKKYGSKVLLAYGGGSIKKNGIYDEIVSLLKERFVDQLHYIDEKEMLDLVAIAQSAPGAIAVNGAIVLGYKMAGILGIIVCVIGTIIPPIVIISVIAYFYKIFITNKIISAMLLGMRAGIGAIIVSVVYDMALSVMDEHKERNIVIMLSAFILNYFLNVNIMCLVLGCILLALVELFIRREKA